MDSSALPVDQVLPPAKWVDAYGDYLFRYAVSRLRDANAAEEVLQETFLAGIRHHDQFAGTGSQRAWLLGILKRKIVDFVRERAKAENADVSEGGESQLEQRLFDESGNWREGAKKWAVEPGRNMEIEELWAIVRECLSHVPPNQADVFVLSVMEEMPSEDICTELSISQSNLWVRLHRARLHLANCVGSHWSDEPAD